MTSDHRSPAVYWLFGLPFDAVDLPGAAGLLLEHARRGQRVIFATPNLNFLRTSRENPAFLAQVLHTDLSLVDGMPLVWLGRLAGVSFRERVAGSSLVEYLVQRPAAPGERLKTYLFGAEGDAAAAAMARLNEPATGLEAVGAMNPGHGSVEALSTPEIIADINASGAQFLVVSLGAVKGHAWIEHNRDRLDPLIISHLGAVVNFLAGTVRRAPPLLQKLGLEWAWRVGQEPYLVRRYFRDGIFLIALLLRALLPALLAARRHAGGALELPAADTDGMRAILRPRGALRAGTVETLAEAVRAATRAGARRVAIEMDGVEYVDSRGLGVLYELRHRSGAEVEVRISGGNPRLQRQLRWHRARCLWDD